MVRYPKKSQQAILDPAPVTPIIEQIHRPKAASRESSDQVTLTLLVAKIEALEKKLGDIQQNEAPPPRPTRNWQKYGWVVWGLAAVPLAIYVGWQFAQPAFAASLVVHHNPQTLNIRGINPSLGLKERMEMLNSSELRIRALQKTLHWPEFLKDQGWLLAPFASLFHERMLVRPTQAPDELFVEVRAMTPRNAKNYLRAVQEVYQDMYVARRYETLVRAFNSVDTQLGQARDRLEKLHQKLDGYRQPERYTVVSPSAKIILDRMKSEQAAQVEEGFISLREKLQNSFMPPMAPKPGFDSLALRALKDRLTNLEFKKFLAASSDLPAYEGGLNVVKAQLAQLVNKYFSARNPDPKAANLVIRFIFLQTKYDALDTLLDERYAPLSTLTGRAAEYASVESEAARLFTGIEQLLSSKQQLDKAVHSDLANEITMEADAAVAKKI